MPELKYVEALREALAEEMRRDDSVICYGEDVRLGWSFGVTSGLVNEFGDDRVFDAPISELGIVTSGVGAAIAGLRPVVELMFSDFVTLAADGLANQAPKVRYMSGGNLKVPLVVRTPFGAGSVFLGGAQHSQSLEAWFMHVPGLYVANPATPADAKGLLKTAIRDDNPVLFCEYKILYQTKGYVPEGEHLVPFGKAAIRREGTDGMIVAMPTMLAPALAAAETIAKENGREVLVLDLRTLNPLDKDCLLSCVQKTKRLLIAEEDTKTGGVGAELAAIVAEEAFEFLDAPIARVAALETPLGAVHNLQDFSLPDEARITARARKLFA